MANEALLVVFTMQTYPDGAHSVVDDELFSLVRRVAGLS
jgi:hypothetical protein